MSARLFPLIVFVFFAQAAFATESVGKFGDWELLCAKTATSETLPPETSPPATSPKASDAAQSCRLAQHHAIVDTKEALLVLNVLKSAQGQPVAVMSVPPGVYLAPGILIRVDQNQPFKLLYETCNGTGCHAGFELKPAVLSAFKRGLKANVRFFNPQQQPVDVAVSLVGFTKGFEALLERSVD